MATTGGDQGSTWIEEPLDQRNVVALLQSLIAEEPLEGTRVVDATAGNGHDTEFLARRVGPGGSVIAIDLQPAAVAATRRRIAQVAAGASAEVDVIEGDHAQLDQLVPADWRGTVALVLFNLGYLPGGGRALTTTCLLYTSPSPRDKRQSRMPSSA